MVIGRQGQIQNISTKPGKQIPKGQRQQNKECDTQANIHKKGKFNKTQVKPIKAGQTIKNGGETKERKTQEVKASQ